MNNRILFVLTSHSALGESGKQTGFHYEEMTTPYYLFKDAGYEVVLASVAGGEPPHDPSSLKDPLEDNPESVKRFLADNGAMNELRHTRTLNELDSVDDDHFCAIYLPGGHGTMWDLPNYSALAKLVSTFYKMGKPVSSVCHGIAGFVGATDDQGEPLVKGKKINCFTDAEEKEVELHDTVPFLLESKVRELGGNFQCSENFEPHLAVDKNLITGQNPPSAELVAKEVLRQLAE